MLEKPLKSLRKELIENSKKNPIKLFKDYNKVIIYLNISISYTMDHKF